MPSIYKYTVAVIRIQIRSEPLLLDFRDPDVLYFFTGPVPDPSSYLALLQYKIDVTIFCVLYFLPSFGHQKI
jgi:hypothetical protein